MPFSIATMLHLQDRGQHTFENSSHTPWFRAYKNIFIFFLNVFCVFAAEFYVFFKKHGVTISTRSRRALCMHKSNVTARVLEALYTHRGQLTEAEAAQLVGLSPSWFRHDFKRHARMSFRTARVHAKLAHGAHLLSTTRLSIPEIADLLGYSDRSKFEKAFKRLHRLTPTVYRDVLLLPRSSNIR